MSILSFEKKTNTQRSQIEKESILRARQEIRRQQVVTFILFVIFAFQLISLPGAIIMQSALNTGTVIFGIGLCGVAMLFNRMGKIGVVSILLILVVDLGCGIMLLTPGMTMADMGSMSSSNSTSSMGNMSSSNEMHASNSMSSTAMLDVSELPTFDLLVVSELIAVSLLPAVSVLWVAVSNILFIMGMVVFLPHTAALTALLKSPMAYNSLMQPISLQIVVAAIAYMWVSSALKAAARADRAEEIADLQRSKAELQQREVEQKHLIESGISELLQGLSQGVNGQEASINLKQDHMLWKVGNAVNLLLTRLRRNRQIDQENKQLRIQLIHMREKLLEAKFVELQESHDSSKQNKGFSLPGF